ncbi:putative leader peptide [Rhodococcoides corynebacterioides]
MTRSRLWGRRHVDLCRATSSACPVR